MNLLLNILLLTIINDSQVYFYTYNKICSFPRTFIAVVVAQ